MQACGPSFWTKYQYVKTEKSHNNDPKSEIVKQMIVGEKGKALGKRKLQEIYGISL